MPNIGIGLLGHLHSEEADLLGYNTMEFFENQQSVALLATCFMLIPCLVYSSTLKMEVTCS
jgi:hypothetical protein